MPTDLGNGKVHFDITNKEDTKAFEEELIKILTGKKKVKKLKITGYKR